MVNNSTSDAAIEVKALCKTYRASKKQGAKAALTSVNLTIPRGSFYGLLGPNGAGKSTLINILAGLTVKTSGSAKICGYNIDTDRRAASKSIGVVPQELVLDPFFTVREALEFHAGYYGIPKKQRRTQEIIDALGLADKASAAPRSLSGGMKRRLLIGKALVHAPEVLVLDEPTAGVDVELRMQLWDYVKELNKQGTTILLTTHYLEEAESLCDHIAVINHGEVIADDTKASLLTLLDQKQLVVQFNERMWEVPKELEELDTSITEDGALVVRYQAKHMPFDRILKLLTNTKLTICDISTEEPDLEDIFRHLIKAV